MTSSHRPLLHHLNADSSWLLQLPIPAQYSTSTSNPSSRKYFNIVIDPWLRGPQSDVARWFSTQWHATASAIQSIAEVSALAFEVEERDDELVYGGNAIDAVVISHEFTDHCHKDTLLEVDRTVLVMAPPKAAELIRSWGHFVNVVDVLPFGEAYKEEVTPAWLSITRLQDPKDALYYHSAAIIRFWNFDKSFEESVIYTPHGVSPFAIEIMQKGAPEVQTLCLIHGLHDIWLTLAQQLNLGGHNGLKVQRALKSKYWVGTHDEVKVGGGLVGFFLRRKVITVDQALEKESKTLKIKGTGGLDDVIFEEIGNGATKTLS